MIAAKLVAHDQITKNTSLSNTFFVQDQWLTLLSKMLGGLGLFGTEISFAVQRSAGDLFLCILADKKLRTKAVAVFLRYFEAL